MHDQVRFKINSKIMWQYIEGEIIVLNLNNGNYYSFRDAAAFLWERLAAGQRIPEVWNETQKAYGELSWTVEAFKAWINSLLDENLLIEAPGMPSVSASPFKTSGKHGEFAQPVFDKYTDMQDYILMDPIHEVGDTGWPAPQQDNPETTQPPS